MSSAATSIERILDADRHSPGVPPPIQRSCSVRAILWINSHPKSLVLALLVLAVGYGVALGCGGLDKDILIGVAAGGGVVLAVSAYVLRRLIFMPDKRRLEMLLGVNLNTEDSIYFISPVDKQYHVMSFFENRDHKWGLCFDEAGQKLLNIDDKDRLLNEMGVSPHIYFEEPSEGLLSQLHDMIGGNDHRTQEEMYSEVLGVKPGTKKEWSLTSMSTRYEITFQYQETEKHWVVTMPCELANHIPNLRYENPNHATQLTFFLVGPRHMSVEIVNFLRQKISQQMVLFS